MILCKITGTVQPAAVLDGLSAAAFVVARTPDGGTITAADTLNSKEGDSVLICCGASAGHALGCRCAVDAVVAAIVKRE